MTGAVTVLRIARLGLPLSASQLLTLALGFVDAAMLSALGAEALAGGGLGIAVFSVVAVSGSSLLAGFTSIAGAAVAADNRHDLDRVVEAGLRLAAAVGAVLFLVALAGSLAVGPLAPSRQAGREAETFLALASLAVPAAG